MIYFSRTDLLPTSKEQFDEMIEWLRVNTYERVEITQIGVTFQSDTDAMLFKLVWFNEVIPHLGESFSVQQVKHMRASRSVWYPEFRNITDLIICNGKRYDP